MALRRTLQLMYRSAVLLACIQLLGHSSAARPQDADATYRLGLERLRAGLAAEARPLFEKAVAAAPEHAAAWGALGLACVSSGDTPRAIAAFGKACDLAPGDGETCYYHGRTLQMVGRYAEAQRSLEQALRHATEPSKDKLHRAIALNLLGLNQPQKAESHFREAIREFSGATRDGEDPRIDYGSFLAREGRAAEAVPMLRQAVEAHPESSRAHSEVGRALLESGKPEEAAKSLEKAVRLDPAAWASRLLLGRAYLQLGRIEEGRRELKLGQEGWSRQENTRTARP